jgi:hypothetical protein
MAPDKLSLFVAAAAVVFYLVRREQAKRLVHDFGDALQEAIDRFRGGGGPTTPMHPSPAVMSPTCGKRAVAALTVRIRASSQ